MCDPSNHADYFLLFTELHWRGVSGSDVRGVTTVLHAWKCRTTEQAAACDALGVRMGVRAEQYYCLCFVSHKSTLKDAHIGYILLNH